MPDGFANFEQGLTAFVVAEWDHDSCEAALEVSNGSEVDDISFLYDQGTFIYEVFDQSQLGDALDIGLPHLFTVRHKTDLSAELRHDSVPTTTASNMNLPLTVTRTQNFLAHSLYTNCPYFQGEIAEILLYSRAVDDTELIDIEAYLSSRWF